MLERVEQPPWYRPPESPLYLNSNRALKLLPVPHLQPSDCVKGGVTRTQKSHSPFRMPKSFPDEVSYHFVSVLITSDSKTQPTSLTFQPSIHHARCTSAMHVSIAPLSLLWLRNSAPATSKLDNCFKYPTIPQPSLSLRRPSTIIIPRRQTVAYQHPLHNVSKQVITQPSRTTALKSNFLLGCVNESTCVSGHINMFLFLHVVVTRSTTLFQQSYD